MTLRSLKNYWFSNEIWNNGLHPMIHNESLRMDRFNHYASYVDSAHIINEWWFWIIPFSYVSCEPVISSNISIWNNDRNRRVLGSIYRNWKPWWNSALTGCPMNRKYVESPLISGWRSPLKIIAIKGCSRLVCLSIILFNLYFIVSY